MQRDPVRLELAHGMLVAGRAERHRLRERSRLAQGANLRLCEREARGEDRDELLAVIDGDRDRVLAQPVGEARKKLQRLQAPCDARRAGRIAVMLMGEDPRKFVGADLLPVGQQCRRVACDKLAVYAGW